MSERESGANPDSIAELTEHVLRHRDERDWAQFHTVKELAISLCVEAGELLSLVQWKTPEQLSETLQARHEAFSDELADVLHSTLLLAAQLNIRLGDALVKKLEKDAIKYPVQKARGRNLKYDEL